MRRWMIVSSIAACLLAVMFVAAAAVFLARPELFLTDRAVAAALRHFGRFYSPRWTALHLSAEALSSRRHRYALTSSGLCVGDRPGVFSVCFTEFEFVAIVAYTRRGPVLERVDRLVAVSGDARVDLRRRDPKAVAHAFPLAVLSTPVRSLRIELSSFTFLSGTSDVTGAVRAELAPDRRRPLAVAADVRVRDASGPRRIKIDLSAATDALDGGTPAFVDLVGNADLGKRGRIRAAFRLKRASSRVTLSGGADYAVANGPVRTFRLDGCEGAAALPAGMTRPDEGALTCHYEMTLADTLPAPFSGIKMLSGRATLNGRLKADSFRIAAAARFAPVASWYELGGDVAVRLDGRLGRPLKDAVVSHDLHATAKIARFEELVVFLRDTKYAVPAPIHVLKGPITLALESRGDSRGPRQTVGYDLSSELAGARQRLALRATGEFAVIDAWIPSRSFEHAGRLTLNEVALEVPRLDIARTPKVIADQRIRTGDDAPAPSPSAAPAKSAAIILPALRGTLAVKTAKPLILFSNLAKDPVPLSLDLLLSYPPPAAAGMIGVQRFGIELFRRTAIVDHLDVVLSSAAKIGTLEGLVLYKTPDVEIRILILGTSEKPRIEFTSVPRMKRKDIIALLIFGKSPDELDPEQTSTVSTTETALESRAFGLASLYLFGATPIEHVGYDSATRTTSVRLRLPGGANLTLGSDFDQSRQLTVRKPLARHWAIQSEVTDQGREGRGATTFLEWFNRY